MAHEELTQSSPHTEATEQELVQRVQAGDATAFDALFRQCCSKVFHQATRFLGNAAEAEEVVQEVFLAVYEKAHTFRGDATFTTWLFRLTANASLSRLRRRKRNKEVAMEEYLPQFRPDGHHLVRPVVDWSANLEERLADAHPRPCAPARSTCVTVRIASRTCVPITPRYERSAQCATRISLLLCKTVFSAFCIRS